MQGHEPRRNGCAVLFVILVVGGFLGWFLNRAPFGAGSLVRITGDDGFMALAAYSKDRLRDHDRGAVVKGTTFWLGNGSRGRVLGGDRDYTHVELTLVIDEADMHRDLRGAKVWVRTRNCAKAQ